MSEADASEGRELSQFYALASRDEAALMDALLKTREGYRHTLTLPAEERLHVSTRELCEDESRSRTLCRRLATAIRATSAFAMVDCSVQAAITRLFGL